MPAKEIAEWGVCLVMALAVIVALLIGETTDI